MKLRQLRQPWQFRQFRQRGAPRWRRCNIRRWCTISFRRWRRVQQPGTAPPRFAGPGVVLLGNEFTMIRFSVHKADVIPRRVFPRFESDTFSGAFRCCAFLCFFLFRQQARPHPPLTRNTTGTSTSGSHSECSKTLTMGVAVTKYLQR